MGFGISIFFVALGAILGFAVHSSPSSFSLTTVGIILMIVGVVGFATSFYLERKRRHLIEDSIEHGDGSQPAIDYDGEIFVEPAPRRQASRYAPGRRDANGPDPE